MKAQIASLALGYAGVIIRYSIWAWAAAWIAFTPASVRADLVSHWAFDEGSGAVASDSAGGNPGQIVGGAGWMPGVLGSSLNLDGANDTVVVTNHPSLNPTPS